MIYFMIVGSMLAIEVLVLTASALIFNLYAQYIEIYIWQSIAFLIVTHFAPYIYIFRYGKRVLVDKKIVWKNYGITILLVSISVVSLNLILSVILHKYSG
jgi:hypothetical protein